MAEETYRNNFQQEEQSDFNFSDIWSMIWGYKWWYVLSLGICLVFAAFYLYKTPATFSRSAKVIINEDAQDATLRDIANISGFAGQGSSVNVNNEVEAFASPDLMTKVVKRLNLETSYVEHQFMRDRELYNNSPVELSIIEPLVMSSFSFKIAKDDDSTFTLTDFTVGPEKLKKTEITGAVGDTLSTPVGTIALLTTLYASNWEKEITVNWVNSAAKAKTYSNNLSATVSGKQTSVVVLSLEDTYPNRAENILSTLIDVYNDEWVHDKNRSARNTTEFINERLVVIEQELGGIETDLKEYKEENKLTDMQALSESYLAESSEYASKSFEVHNQLSIAQYIRDYLTEPANANALIPANSGLTSTDIESQISEYNQIVLQRDKLISSSSDKNPLIADMNAAMISIQDKEPGRPDYGPHSIKLGTTDGAPVDRKTAEGKGIPLYLSPSEKRGKRDSKSRKCREYQTYNVPYRRPCPGLPEQDDDNARSARTRSRHPVRNHLPQQDNGQYGIQQEGPVDTQHTVPQ